MREISVSGKKAVLDEDGFLCNPDDWNQDVAKEIAKQLSIPNLSEEQLEIIDFLRQYYYKFNAFPILNYVCKHVGQPRKCLNDEFVDPMKAWKIAGLPKLEGIHFVSVDGKNFRLEECC
ncbi:MAG: TusE/DsrC/DsvC family sulfur relay protein [Desulfocapsaceae bacterium]|jgi:tRNA 2-thiouridine synthesizing protein E|nr:TusE/DsrC/DsvC family sulfur relay protein [Desulfocapsaceae bacterium]